MKRKEFLQASQKKRNIITLLLCFAGVGVNLLLSYICGKLSLPLYLDTIGSVVVAILGGYLPGVIVGLITNALKTITDPSALYYGVLNVLIAVVAAWMSKRGWFKKIYGIMGAVFVFTLIGGGIGTLIPWFMDDLTFDSESLSGKLYDMGLFGFGMSHLVSSLIMDFIDKAASMVIIMVIVKLIPHRMHKYFSFSGWMQTPLSSRDEAAAGGLDSRVMSLRTKILLVLSVSLITVSAAATTISLMLYRNALIKDRTRLAEATANVAAAVLDPDRIDDYLERGETSVGYSETRQSLEGILASSTDISYLYVYRIRSDGCYVIFDIDTEETEGAKLGDIEPFDSGMEQYVSSLVAGEAIEPIITHDEYGWLLTAYQPVYDSDGECTCYVCADVEMERIAQEERDFLVEMLALFLGIFILVFVFISWLVKYHVIMPVNSISMTTSKFAYDNEKAREDSYRRLNDLEIHTGDEVENLYHSIAKTSTDSMRYVADVQKKNEEIEQMQNALIMVLADIVESRDSNTGAHVRKTAAYTEIILKEMRRKGYYADMLTDEYIKDVVSSAPLHDVGKIQVPDAILNKPGRLTDEEFDIMKTHTTVGRDIINEAIAIVPESGYLDEARNLATYHHEKWNGSGYPFGKSSEDIPLSARVMAVADVFDALVSKRSYKEPFSHEKAMEIIKEGSGSHFDPLIVDAFVSAEDEVREVEVRFSNMTDATGSFNTEKKE